VQPPATGGLVRRRARAIEEIPGVADEAAVGTDRIFSETVLIVEDDPAVQQTLGRFLRHHGYVTIVSDSVKNAIAVARRQHVDAITLDLSLCGGTTGLDFLVWLRHTPNYMDTPVTILTGATILRPDQVSMMRRPHTTLMFKPAPYDELLGSIRRVRDTVGAVTGESTV
jgi:DNA-binding response OmpR family regulator